MLKGCCKRLVVVALLVLGGGAPAFAQNGQGAMEGTPTGDIGHQSISFLDNLYRNITQRAPRVRFGKVHTANNYFTGSKTDPVYPHLYSIGTGLQSQIISSFG